MANLGKFELFEQLGKGGFGIVYRALDRTLEREVAVKVLHPQLAVDADFIQRFRDEARIIARLEHPNIVTIHEMGEEEGRIFIVMRYLAGGSLARRLAEQGSMPYAQALGVMRQVCAGVSAAHKKGLVHRDLKPANILFDAEGQAVVSDFGLARAVQMSSTSTASGVSGMGGVGTPHYRAPELWLGKPPASPGTDVYSLACVFVEMLSGRRLFEGDTPDVVIARHLVTGPEFPAGWLPADAPAGLQAVMDKALQRDPAQRYASVEAWMGALADLERRPAPVPSLQKETRVAPLPPALQPAAIAPPPEKARFRAPSAKILWGLLVALVAVFSVLLVLGAIKDILATPATAATQAATIQPLPSDTPRLIPTATSQPAPTDTLEPTEISNIPPACTEIGQTWVSPVDGMTLVCVPEGEFTMGSNTSENEKPIHTVFLDAFWIDQTEVTNAMYQQCVAAKVCRPPEESSSYTRSSYYGNSQYDDYPVIYVSWDDAVDYCQWAGRELPTEAQWEKAARGTDGFTYPWGNEAPTCSLANFDPHNANICVGDTSAVDSHLAVASQYGAYDMAGNVWEWVSDWYNEDYYSSSPNNNPTGPVTGDVRVLRGGSWIDDVNSVRASIRYWIIPGGRGDYYGFRCSD